MEKTPITRPVALILGSKSPARLQVLRSAGVKPVVVTSDVDEDAVAARLPAGSPPEAVVTALALAKAEAVTADVVDGLNEASGHPRIEDADRYLVLGADSMLFINGRLVGKPHTAEVARERIAEMRNTDAVLWTGHALIPIDRAMSPTPGGWVVGGPVVAAASTIVHFGDISDDEIAAYVASGEPLKVAGSFTIDGLGGPFVRGVTGDPHSVVGVSLPLLRNLTSQVGVFWPDLWS